jgi:serine/threonine protein kinase
MFAAERMAGHRFGHYEILRELSAGGVGRTFVALAHGGPACGREVCVKLLSQEHRPSGDSWKRAEAALRHEAHVMAQLTHPNIAALLDSGVHRQATYLAFELVQGADLLEILRRERRLCEPDALHLLEPEHVAHVGLGVARALGWAHQHDVLHRDVKPANIMIGTGAQAHVKLVDFGIAKLGAADASNWTRVGTPRYLSPEALLGEPLSPRTDVHALGLVLFEALAGAHPYHVEDEAEFRRNVLEGSAVQSLRDRQLPEALVELVEACIDPDPDKRPCDGLALERALLATGLGQADPSSLIERAQQARDARRTLEDILDEPTSELSGLLSEEPTSLNTRPERPTRAVDVQQLAREAAVILPTAEHTVMGDLQRMNPVPEFAEAEQTAAPANRRRRKLRGFSQPRDAEPEAIPDPVVLPTRSVASALWARRTRLLRTKDSRAWRWGAGALVGGTLALASVALGPESPLDDNAPRAAIAPVRPARVEKSASPSPTGSKVVPEAPSAPARAVDVEAPQGQVPAVADALEPEPTAERTAATSKHASPPRAPESRARTTEPVAVQTTIALIPGGEVRVDGRWLGRAPVTVALKPGSHLVAAANESVRISRHIAVPAHASTHILDLRDETP